MQKVSLAPDLHKFFIPNSCIIEKNVVPLQRILKRARYGNYSFVHAS